LIKRLPVTYLIGRTRLKALICQLGRQAVFHGVALEDPGGLGVLIFGSPKKGKTTIAIEFIRRQGYKLISDDLLLLTTNSKELYAHPVNNQAILVRGNNEIRSKQLNRNNRSAHSIKIHRVYTLDEYNDYKKYLTGKIYNLQRVPAAIRPRWINRHNKIITKLLEIEPENIQ